MRAASPSGTSLMISDFPKTFATFRVVGDRLDPEQITGFLKVVPKYSYAKGQRYSAGNNSQRLLGKTGVWFFSTDNIVASSDLSDHLGYLLVVLFMNRNNDVPTGAQLANNLLTFKKLLGAKSLKPVVTCFWHGAVGSKKPSVPAAITDIFNFIGAEIETDFATEDLLSTPRLVVR
jgi:Domain of unknown function (DUF4279)